MKLALLSDIHGNSIALDAVLADVERSGGVDGYWVLGDLVALGPDPVGVLERLAALPGLSCVRGNTDRYVVTGERPSPTSTDVRADPELLPTLIEIAGSFAWTQGAVTAAGWLPWLTALSLDLTLELQDGTRLLGVHAAPGQDDGSGITPEMSDAALAASLEGCAADLICVGHTHRALDRRVGAWRVVNLGSVSNPPVSERRASYVVLDAAAADYTIEHRLVDYDRRAVVRLLEQLRHPGAAFITQRLMDPE